jgi:hypothetical protein
MRPSKFSVELGHAIAIHIGYGCSVEQAAQAEGIVPDTIRRWLRRYPAFAAEVDQARAHCVAKLLHRVNCAAEKDWRAAAWLLERLHPESYGQVRSHRARHPMALREASSWPHRRVAGAAGLCHWPAAALLCSPVPARIRG